jgi:hypothetical protein
MLKGPMVLQTTAMLKFMASTLPESIRRSCWGARIQDYATAGFSNPSRRAAAVNLSISG